MSKHEIGIIGGSGFIGSALARYLGNLFRVKILDLKPISEDLEGRVDFQRCDIRNYDEIKERLQGVDLVIHTAIVQIPLINLEGRLGYEVNVIGTQNVCEAVHKSNSIKGVLLTSSWHVFGERGFHRIIDEEFGFGPDKTEERARFYVLTKIAQETIVRLFDELSEKTYGIIRIGTALGEGMPEKTAANIFVTNGLKGIAITPYKHSMYRPMLYVDINDVCKGFEAFAKKILNGDVENRHDSSFHIVNLMWPKSITILDLAKIVRDAVMIQSQGKFSPEIKILDQKKPLLYSVENKNMLSVDLSKAERFLGLENMISPQGSINRIVRQRLSSNQ